MTYDLLAAGLAVMGAINASPDRPVHTGWFDRSPCGTGAAQYFLDPDDPFPGGFLL
ncbi:hypothetical protein [Streptomyces sp. NPDC002671]